MFTLPTLPEDTLAQAHKAIQSTYFSLSAHEEKAIAHTSLFLHNSESLDHEKLENAIKNTDKSAINSIVHNGLLALDNRLTTSITANRFTGQSEPLHIGISIEFQQDSLSKESNLVGTVSADSYAYDLQPLEYLSDNDAEIVAYAISEIRAILLLSPLPEDMEEFGSWRAEVLEDFNEWLPKNIRNKEKTIIQAYWDEHCESFQEGEYCDDESLVDDHFERSIPRPNWYPFLNKHVGHSKPKLALKKLKQKVNFVSNSDAKTFVNEVITSISVFLRHFKTNKAWESYSDSYGTSSQEFRGDNPDLDLAFMMTWGSDGYWWDIVEDIGRGLMEVGESPSYIRDITQEADQMMFIVSAEQLFRGTALYLKLTDLTNLLSDQQDLPNSETMDNG